MYPILRFFLYCTFFFFLLSPPLIAQSISPEKQVKLTTKFEYFTKEQGLDQASVVYLVEDSLGFVWLGTKTGVFRFDGREFKHFTPATSGLSGGYVTTLFIDSNQNFWVGTETGLNQYDPKLERFDSFVNRGLADEFIWSVFEDRSRRLWIGASDGIYFLNQKKQRFEKFNFYLHQKAFPLKEVKTIFQDNDGFIWLSTDRGENYIVDPLLNNLYQLSEDNPTGITLNQGRINQAISHNNGHFIVRDKDVYYVSAGKVIAAYELDKKTSVKFIRGTLYRNNELWLSSDQGIFKYELNGSTLELKERLETNHKIFSLLVDKKQNIWFGTLQNGLGLYLAQRQLFSHLSSSNKMLADDVVWSITEGQRNEIWIAGNSPVLSRFNIEDNQINHFDSQLSGIKSLAVINNEIYVGSYQGLYQYSIESNLLVKNKLPLIDFEVTYLAHDNDYIYASSWGKGLYRVGVDSSITMPIEGMSFGKDALPYITTLKHSGKRLYVGTLNGFYVFDLNSGLSKEVVELSGKRISYVSVNGDEIYVSTGDSGVYKFDYELKSIKTHYEHEKLLNRTIYSAFQDDNDDLWMSTDRGILKLATNLDVHHYDTSDGLGGLDFNDNSALISHGGVIFFGGSKGLNFIKPKTVSDFASTKSQLLFTDFTVFNNEVAIGKKEDGNVKLQESIITASEVTLEYSDYPFEITYNLVNYPQPQKVKYQYKLIDIDDAWLKGKKSQTSTYTSLEAGEYQFVVQALNASTDEVLATNSLRVNILPPLWLSSIAIAFYTLIALIILFAILHIVNQRKNSAREIRRGAKRLELSLWGSGDLMWDWDIIKNKIYHSEHWQQFDYQGLSEGEFSKIHPKDRDKVAVRLSAHLSDETEFFEASYRIKRHGEDSWIWIVDRAKVVERTSDGKPLRMSGTIRDITLLKNAEERLNMQANVMSNISDAIYVMDLQFNVVDVNKSFAVITGLTPEQVLNNQRVFNTYHGRVAKVIKSRLDNGMSWNGEVNATKPDGEQYSIELHVNPMLDNDDEISHYVAAFSDITQRKQTEQELRDLSNIDPLTKLPNRSYFQYAHRNLIRRKEPHALLTMDVDNFKKINDSMGHDEGDKLLCMISERIDNQINCQHLLCRLGGDEFALLLEDINDISMITQVLYDIEGAMQDPFDLSGESLVMNCSIGVAIYPNDGETTENMLQSADTAMYHAKSESGFSYQLFDSSMNESAVRRLQIEGMIRQALKNDWFEVYYQPKIDLKTESVMGMEALVRLVHPELGMISPSEFIPIAEDTGLVIAIGEKVLDKACYATQQWRKNGLFNGRVAVNLAAKQFSQEDLLQRIDHILECTQLPLANLELEITEGTVIEDPELAITTMQSLVDKGIHLALDDFGTGYSSLSYLRRFPIHTLKIDKAFIDDLGSEKEERQMVASIISIAHNMDVSVVAEGVEEEEQIAALKQLNCETIQGYFYSRPLSEQDFTSYLLKNQKNTKYSTTI